MVPSVLLSYDRQPTCTSSAQETAGNSHKSTIRTSNESVAICPFAIEPTQTFLRHMIQRTNRLMHRTCIEHRMNICIYHLVIAIVRSWQSIYCICLCMQVCVSLSLSLSYFLCPSLHIHIYKCMCRFIHV